MEVSIRRCSSNRLRCVYGVCIERTNLFALSKEKRFEIVKKHGIFVPKDARVCLNHIETGSWQDFVPEELNYTQNQMEDLIALLRSENNKCESISSANQ